MKRLALFGLAGLLLGGVIHIAIIFLMPGFADREAWETVGTFGPDNRFNGLPEIVPGEEPLPALDPNFAYAVCRFTLDVGVLRMTAELPSDFWSIAIFDRRGRSIYSLNDRSAERGMLDIAVIRPDQMMALRQAPASALETAIVVEAPIDSGFALLRVFLADPAYRARAERALADARCAHESLEDPRG